MLLHVIDDFDVYFFKFVGQLLYLPIKRLLIQLALHIVHAKQIEIPLELAQVNHVICHGDFHIVVLVEEAGLGVLLYCVEFLFDHVDEVVVHLRHTDQIAVIIKQLILTNRVGLLFGTFKKRCKLLAFFLLSLKIHHIYKKLLINARPVNLAKQRINSGVKVVT